MQPKQLQCIDLWICVSFKNHRVFHVNQTAAMANQSNHVCWPNCKLLCFALCFALSSIHTHARTRRPRHVHTVGVFGVPLEELPTSDPSLVPVVVKSIVDYITQHGTMQVAAGAVFNKHCF